MGEIMNNRLFKTYVLPCILCMALCFFTSCPNGAGGTFGGTLVTVTVLDSVGGTPIRERSTLAAYKAGTTILEYTSVPVVNGTARLYLSKDQCYDLRLSGIKDKLAASVIENYWVKSDRQTVTMIQRVPQQGALTEARAYSPSN